MNQNSLPDKDLKWSWLVLALAALAAIRIVGANVLALPVESDGKAYILMAEAMADGMPPADNFGQVAFYSVGYPLFLTPFVAAFGSGLSIVILVNAALAVASGVLVFALARTLGLQRIFALVAVMLFAVWIPGVWNGAQAAKENLSIPLLLLLLLAAIRIYQGGGVKWLVVAGLSYGFGLLTGGSTILLIMLPAIALYFDTGRAWAAKLKHFVLVAISCAAIVIPWLVFTATTLGAPVLNTNGGFNLYLGNNPAATGYFVSIDQTPAGPEWSDLRTSRGELGASQELADRAKDHIISHPVDTATLAAKKLAVFWAPNLPDAADFSQSPMVAQMRILEVTQYLLILFGGLAGLVIAVRDRRPALLCGAAIGLFWVLHAAAYIIPRYRDPVMPVLLIGSAALIAWLVQKYRRTGALHVS